jgi:glycosyltransferase involved in cell wall biosynthesis
VPHLRVSVIIPHLNTPDLLSRCLASVSSQQLDEGEAEIIVVDNGSTVDLSAVHAAFPQVQFLTEARPGPGLARNHGAAAARGSTLAFIDADCRAAPGWLQAAVNAVESDPGRGVFGGDIRIEFADPAHPTGVELFEAVFGFRQQMYIEKRHFSVTANMAMDPAVLAAVGGFAGIDRAEDLDWGQRAHARGFVTRFCADMLVWHPARDSLAALQTKWRRLIRHDWNGHVASGRSVWRWRARAAALVAAVPVEVPRFLLSDRVSGAGNIWRGTLALAQIRWFRAAEMLRVVGSEDRATPWNSAP